MITITVGSDDAREGKTSVAVIIAKALRDAGANVSLLSEDTASSLGNKINKGDNTLLKQSQYPEIRIYDGSDRAWIDKVGGVAPLEGVTNEF